MDKGMSNATHANRYDKPLTRREKRDACKNIRSEGTCAWRVMDSWIGLVEYRWSPRIGTRRPVRHASTNNANKGLALKALRQMYAQLVLVSSHKFQSHKRNRGNGLRVCHPCEPCFKDGAKQPNSQNPQPTPTR